MGSIPVDCINMKTTNIISERTVSSIIKTVKCPYCHNYLEPIIEYAISIICWNCKKEFKIEQDNNKWEWDFKASPSVTKMRFQR